MSAGMMILVERRLAVISKVKNSPSSPVSPGLGSNSGLVPSLFTMSLTQIVKSPGLEPLFWMVMVLIPLWPGAMLPISHAVAPLPPITSFTVGSEARTGVVNSVKRIKHEIMVPDTGNILLIMVLIFIIILLPIKPPEEISQ